MDTSRVLRLFPLVPRPRPPCTPLATRVHHICELARTAASSSDLAAASAGFNQAALLASDCGQPDLARAWCQRHAASYLRAIPLDAQTARYALEPLLNLARLHIRDGNGNTAYSLLGTLYQAVSASTDILIDGIPIPASQLTRSREDLLEVCRWLWTIQLADSPRALISAGRWQAALTHLEHHHGIGQRMLDGRQVAVICKHLAGDASGALELLSTTATQEAWEDTVISCLTTLCRQQAQLPANQTRSTMLGSCRELPTAPELALFRTRLTLAVIETAGGIEHRDTQALANELIAQVTSYQDGYAAREILSHNDLFTLLTNTQARTLSHITEICALGIELPAQLSIELTDALDILDLIIRRLTMDHHA
jgi:hypothetical protein